MKGVWGEGAGGGGQVSSYLALASVFMDGNGRPRELKTDANGRTPELNTDANGRNLQVLCCALTSSAVVYALCCAVHALCTVCAEIFGKNR